MLKEKEEEKGGMGVKYESSQEQLLRDDLSQVSHKRPERGPVESFEFSVQSSLLVILCPSPVSLPFSC